MNTTEIGNTLEDDVFRMLEELMTEGDIPVNKEYCKIYRKKNYFSAIRGSDVRFENIIEVFNKDNFYTTDAQPSLVIIIECKNHLRQVEVGEIDEFSSKINHPFGFRIKGYMVSRTGFQSGTVNTANKLGIGLIRILPNDQVGKSSVQHISYCRPNHVSKTSNSRFPTARSVRQISYRRAAKYIVLTEQNHFHLFGLLFMNKRAL
jgi:hypothetical protein